jgi:UrcA family protein
MSMASKAGFWINAAALLLAGAWQYDARAAAAAPPAEGEVNQITVRFAELNLDTPAGAAVLYRRIRHAAERVCGERQQPGTGIVSTFWRSCVAQSVARAVASVDRPALTAYHRVHTAPSDHHKASTVALAASSQR